MVSFTRSVTPTKVIFLLKNVFFEREIRTLELLGETQKEREVELGRESQREKENETGRDREIERRGPLERERERVTETG